MGRNDHAVTPDDPRAGRALTIAPAGPDNDDTLAIAAIPPTPTVVPGAMMGRYTVLEPIGSGGMGTVFAAHDPQLGRRIALKVLRTPATDPAARAELLREGQALAMLSHANVVPVYDVGVADGLVWLAMPEVRGGSLSRWLATPERSWREILGMFIGAGHGLAAAHDAGLVHGDFKPHNVLIDARGEACVVDFGLARRSSTAPASDHTSPEAVPPHDHSTHNGLVRGTPAYMAPEQLCGQPLDARTDQFAFCVALFTALYRHHPFIAEERRDAPVVVSELLDRINAGRIVRRPAGASRSTGLPRSVDRLLMRGLAAKPDQRWPSMRSVVERLDRARRTRGRRLVPVFVATAGVAAALAWPTGSRPSQCRGEDELDEVWNDDRATAVSSQLRSFDAPFAADTAVRVGQGLELWAAAWRTRQAEVCATGQTDALRCLDEALAGFTTTLEVLERANATTLARAIPAMQALPSPAACGRGDASYAVDSPQLRALNDDLAEVEALDAAGRFDAALAAAQLAVVTADALDEPVAAARAHRLLGGVLENLGQYARAEGELDRARWIALELGRDDLAVTAMASLIKLVGHDLARLDDGRAIERHAEAGLARFTPDARLLASLRNAQGLLRSAAGEPDAAIERFAEAIDLTASAPDGELRLRAPLNNYANALAAAGRYDEARAALERAALLVERNLGSEHPSLVGYAANLGFVAERQGRSAEARTYLERAVALAETVLGPDHPNLYEAVNNLAVFHYSRGDLVVAEQLFERALVSARRHLGPDHPALGRIIGNLALCASERGEPERALLRYDEALALGERGLGPDHIDVALTLNNRGSALRRLGRLREARLSYERALAIREAKLGEDHPDIATTIDNLGLLALAEGTPRVALALHQRAYEIWHRAHGETHRRVAGILADLAADHVALGERAQARGLLERSESIWGAIEDADPTDAAQTWLALAELLDDDPVRARALARKALDGFATVSARWEPESTRARAVLTRIGG